MLDEAGFGDFVSDAAATPPDVGQGQSEGECEGPEPCSPRGPEFVDSFFVHLMLLFDGSPEK